MTDWDQRFMDLAKHVAGWSKDPSTKVGAVIVNEKKQVLSMGYNGFPRGVNDDLQRYSDRPTKLKFVAHAERNALDNAYVDVDGATLYSTLYPCSECAKGIIQRGIKKVVTSREWYEHQSKIFSFDVSETMFKEANVEIELV
ncbi:CMP deaminase [bacterium]|nr:CMP deaminase [bacterium]